MCSTIRYVTTVGNSQHYVAIKVTLASLFPSRGDRSAKPHNSTECRRRRLCRQLVVAVGSASPLDVGDVKVPAAANVGQRSPPTDGETRTDFVAIRRGTRYQGNVSRPTIAHSRKSRGTKNFEEVKDLINWYVGISYWSDAKDTQTTAFRHMTISQVLCCISKGRCRRRQAHATCCKSTNSLYDNII